MSIISSLFMFLLCLSLHACNARHFGVVDTDSSSQLHFPSKVEEKIKPNMDSSQRETNGDSITDRSYSGAITQNPKESKALLQDIKYNKGAISGVAQIKSLVSVSPNVPQKNRDTNPGFYSDYSPPKTHPPSHN